MADGLNGHTHAIDGGGTKLAMLARIDSALAAMTLALLESGFTEYEVSEINMSTRFAIITLVKERGRKL